MNTPSRPFLAWLKLGILALLNPAFACEPPRIADYQVAGTFAPNSDPLGPAMPEDALILVEVDGVPISLAQFQRQLGAFSSVGQARYVTGATRQRLLEGMVHRELLAALGEQLDLADTPFVTQAVELALAHVVRDRLAQTAVDCSEIADDELINRYERDRDLYQRPAQVRASLLVVPDEEVARMAWETYDRRPERDLAASIEMFHRLELEYGLEVAGFSGTDLGFIERTEEGGPLSQELSDAVFGLRAPGEITRPRLTGAGWVIVLLTQRRQAASLAFEEVHPIIRQQLCQERMRAWEQRWIGELRAATPIDIDSTARLWLDTPVPQGTPAEFTRSRWLVADDTLRWETILTPRRDLSSLASSLSLAPGIQDGAGTPEGHPRD